MITELEELVFGLNSYEKTKVEDRFLIIEQKIPIIKISNIEEYTMLENCIFKIREQLRVKSSNLNTNIKKTNKLTKKKVNEILFELEEIRLSILHRAFNNDLEVIHKKNILKQNEVEQHFVEDDGSNNKNKEIIEAKTEKIIPKEVNMQISEKNNENPKKIILNENSNLSEIKEIFSLNESLQLSNSLITMHSKENSLAVLDKSDFNTSPLHLKKNTNSDELESLQSKLKLSEKYINLNKSEPKIQTKKEEEDSLEELINSKESTHKNIFTVDKNEEKLDISIENETNPIIIERKEIIEQKKEEEKILPYNEEKTNTTLEEIEIDSNTIPDDVLNISIDSFAKSVGQYKLQFKNNQDLINQNDSDVMYSMVFSKVLLQSMFESIQPQATMIVSSLNSDSIYLTPRYINDEVFNFNRIQENDSNLQSTQNKILQTMQDSLQISKTNSQNSNEIIREVEESNNETIPQLNIENVSENKIENKEEKAKYLLSSLRRLA